MTTTSSNPAETYESYMVPTLFEPYASRLMELAKPQPGERILDVACGTGIAARLAVPIAGTGGRVVGVDVNPFMLEVARKTAIEEGLTIEWHEGRAEILPFPDGSFDLVLCQFGLMFFADRQAAVNEMRRVLTEGGRVAIGVWQGLDRHPFYRKLDEVIQSRLGMSGIGDIFGLGDADQLRELMTNGGFHHVEIEPVSLTARFPQPEAFLAGEIDVDTAAIPSMQHLDAAARQEITAAIRDDMADTLRAVSEADHVVIPFHALVVLATAAS